MAAYRRVYDSHHLQDDCQEPGSARNPTLGNRVWATFYLFTPKARLRHCVELATVSPVPTLFCSDCSRGEPSSRSIFARCNVRPSNGGVYYRLSRSTPGWLSHFPPTFVVESCTGTGICPHPQPSPLSLFPSHPFPTIFVPIPIHIPVVQNFFNAMGDFIFRCTKNHPLVFSNIKIMFT